MKNDNFLLNNIQALASKQQQKQQQQKVETPIFRNNNGFYYLSRTISLNLRTLKAKVLE